MVRRVGAPIRLPTTSPVAEAIAQPQHSTVRIQLGLVETGATAREPCCKDPRSGPLVGGMGRLLCISPSYKAGQPLVLGDTPSVHDT